MPNTLFQSGETRAAGMLEMTEEWGDIPRVSRFSVTQGPQGAVFSIIKLGVANTE